MKTPNVKKGDLYIEHTLKGTKPMPECDDLHTLLGAVKGKEYSCPNCGVSYNDTTETYMTNNERYPKCFNESKGYTMDGSYWDWDEVHCCENCETKYWFSNGAY
jgi:hypothetical protein|tara:strand:- start:41458 stop:41769 length:312 start_codon:yes stop_codon:yes gene_type:complete